MFFGRTDFSFGFIFARRTLGKWKYAKEIQELETLRR